MSFARKKTLLIAAFGGFAGFRRNPAEVLARRLARAEKSFALAGIDLRVEILPVSHDEISPTLTRIFARHGPDAVLFLGVAGRRAKISIEFCARNRVSMIKPDADQRLPFCRSLVHGAPERFYAPQARRLLGAARRLGLDARESHDAGDYLCNEALYLALLRDWRAGFIHIPAYDEPALRRTERAFRELAKFWALGA